jgi:hypothetical protein
MFNEAQGGKIQINKMFVNKCLGLAFRVKYECLKELMQKFLTFTSENKTHFSFYK